jgi:hypothetical protein
VSRLKGNCRSQELRGKNQPLIGLGVFAAEVRRTRVYANRRLRGSDSGPTNLAARPPLWSESNFPFRYNRTPKAVDVQILLLDEIHNILAGTFREQRTILNVLRYLSNELRISLVCFGVNEAREAISGDVQLARRFEEYPLPRWSADENFEQLILAIIRNVPLREPSALSARAIRRILQVTGGITARVFRMLDELAIDAITTGAERITDDAIERWHPVAGREVAFA